MCLTCSVGLDKELAYYVLSICAYIMRYERVATAGAGSVRM